MSGPGKGSISPPRHASGSGSPDARHDLRTPDPARWAAAEAVGERCLDRLGELGARYVVGTRAASEGVRHFNEGFLWTAPMSREDGRRS
jgi:hypothetical protein